MTPQIFSHGNFLAFAKFSSRQSFLVKFPSGHLFLPREKKQLENGKNGNKHSSRFLCLNLAMTHMFVLRGSIT